MKDENIKLLIKNEFENGAGVTELSKKYKVSANTINSWKKREKWQKKVALKENAPNSKKRTKKRNGANNKETQIKSDIIDDVSKYEIMAKNGISERTYYRKKQSVRVIQIEKSQTILTEITEEKYSDLKTQLSKLEEEKRKLKEKFLKIGLEDDETLKRIKERLKVLKEFEKEIYKGGQIIGVYRQAELEMELENENIQKEKLEIEKSKLKTDVNEDNKIEIKLVGI
nr:MAG TPA: transposase [Caudoviricetes sp.]